MALTKLVRGQCPIFTPFILRLRQVPCFVLEKRTLQQKPELPKIPRKPLTAYIQFMLHHHTEIRRKNSMLTNEEVQNVLVQMWQSLTFEEKNLWSLKYEREKAEYNQWFEEFAEKKNAQQIGKPLDCNIKKKVTNKLKPVEDWETLKKMDLLKQKVKKDSNSLEKPKSPGNSFSLYLNSIKQNGVQLKNFLVEGSAMWQKLPEEEKEIFQEKAKQQRDKYEADLLEWEVKMYKAGRSDLIRSNYRKLLEQKSLRDKGS